MVSCQQHRHCAHRAAEWVRGGSALKACIHRRRSLAGKVLSRQKSVPQEERQRVQAEAATAQAAAEEARFDLARKLTEACPQTLKIFEP